MSTDQLDIAEDSIIKVRPVVFDYVDYRIFLKDVLSYKKFVNPSYSENAFIFAAGFGKNSRGYFGLVVKGKRNLTTKSIMGFSSAIGLSAEEAIYFENMVLFNQAETEKEKVRFFERMKVGAKGKKAKLIQVLEHQYRYLNEWHLIVLRELVNLKDFKEDPEWIIKKLGGNISKQKVIEGLNDLLGLGLITRDASGKFVQSTPIVLFEDDSRNFKSSSNLHKEFALRASEAMDTLPYSERGAQLITMSVSKDRFEDLRNEMKNFTKRILEEYVSTDESSDVVIQLGSQLLQVTK